jgi:hypothetical protein
MQGLQALKTIWGNYGTTFTQDVASLKTAAAFTATLIHCLLRVLVAAKSVVVAPNQDKAFVKRQSAEVYFREAVGFTLGYGVVKTGDGFIKKKVAEHLGFKPEAPQTAGLFKSLGQSVNALTGKKLLLEEAPYALTGQRFTKPLTNDPKPKLQALGTFARDKLPAFLDEWHGLSASSVSREALELGGFTLLHNVVPLAISSVPAILISGWFLERLTLFKGEQVVDAVVGVMDVMEGKGFHHSKQQLAQAPASHPLVANPLPKPMTPSGAKPLPYQPTLAKPLTGSSLAVNTPVNTWAPYQTGRSPFVYS